MSPSKKRNVSDAGLDDHDDNVSPAALLRGEPRPKVLSANAVPPDANADNAPSCWICLEEGPDDMGAPLVRDCSCRGSAGFSHLSCLVKYAETQSKNAFERVFESGAIDFDAMTEAFKQCPNCMQEYQNNLVYQMQKHRLSFIESDYQSPNSRDAGETSGLREMLALPLTLNAMVGRINVLDEKNDKDVSEGDKLVAKLLPMIEEFTTEFCAQIPPMLHDVAIAYSSIGSFHFLVGANNESRERLEKSKFYAEKACELFERMGKEISLMSAKRNLAIVEAYLSESGESAPDHDLDFYRACYNDKIHRRGEDDAITIKAGVDLAEKLHHLHHGIEAERLLTKLIEISSRVHGASHECTQKVVSILTAVQVRGVQIKSKGEWKKGWYQALGYEDDGERCIVQGPMPENPFGPRNLEEEQKFSVPSKDILAATGTPVICHGLRCRSNSHLNGKIGDVNCYNEKHSKCIIDFEEEGLKSAVVNVTNFRILFDLPMKE